MRKRTVAIDRLAIRLHGVAPETARAAAGELGREVLRQLAGEGPARPQTGRRERVDLGTVRVAPNITSSELRRTIASSIAVSMGTGPHGRVIAGS